MIREEQLIAAECLPVRPRILLFAIGKGSAALPVLFADGGFEVAVLAARDGQINRDLAPAMRAANRFFPLRTARIGAIMRRDLIRAVEAFRPDIIVPCEDRAHWFLHHCAMRAVRAPASLSPGLIACLRRSLGTLETNDARAFAVRLVRHDGMAAAAAAMIGSYGASGFVSFDFIVDRAGRAHLLECNPRPIALLQLGALAGVDMITALREGLAGHVPAEPIVNHAVEQTARLGRGSHDAVLREAAMQALALV